MATPDLQTLAGVAANYNVPPQLIRAIGIRDQAFKGNYNDGIWATTIARTLRDLFAKTQDWNKALATFKTGDADVADSPTNPASGWVASVLGIAGSEPMYGMQQYRPANSAEWKGSAEAFKSALSGLVALGGVVTADGLAALDKHLQDTHPPEYKTQRPAAPADHPQPEEWHPQQFGQDFSKVADFVGKAIGLGIDPEHFSQHYGHAAKIGRRLLGKAPTLEEFSHMVGMDSNQILEHLSNKPHPTYPEVTAGAYHRALHKATLYSGKLNAPRMPYPSEALRFAATDANDATIEKYYGIQPKQEKEQ